MSGASLPISIVHVGMWKADGTPMATVTSAVCARCGAWATDAWSSRSTESSGDLLTDVRVSRSTTVTVYACAAHADEVGWALTDEYGVADHPREDELALEVVRVSRMERALGK